MQNAFSAFFATSLVAIMAFFAAPNSAVRPTAPEPAAPQPVAARVYNAPESSQAVEWQSDLLSAIDNLGRKIDQAAVRNSAPVLDVPGFDPGGSDGVNGSSTWPAPPSQPKSPLTPNTSGDGSSGSTGGYPAGYQTVRYSYAGGFAGNYSDGYSSNGGYSSRLSQPAYSTPVRQVMQAAPMRTRLLDRVRSVQPVRSGSPTCVDGVCTW